MYIPLSPMFTGSSTPKYPLEVKLHSLIICEQLSKLSQAKQVYPAIGIPWMCCRKEVSGGIGCTTVSHRPYILQHTYFVTTVRNADLHNLLERLKFVYVNLWNCVKDSKTLPNLPQICPERNALTHALRMEGSMKSPLKMDGLMKQPVSND